MMMMVMVTMTMMMIMQTSASAGERATGGFPSQPRWRRRENRRGDWLTGAAPLGPCRERGKNRAI